MGRSGMMRNVVGWKKCKRVANSETKNGRVFSRPFLLSEPFFEVSVTSIKVG